MRSSSSPRDVRNCTHSTPCCYIQRRRNDNINKICVLEGVEEGKLYGKLSQNAVLPGNSMTIIFGKYANFIVRNFVVIWEAPIHESTCGCLPPGLCLQRTSMRRYMP